MKKIERALLFAESAHFGQKYDRYPYMYHLLCCKEVAESYLLGEDLVIACLLHDVIEDSSISFGDIKFEFGEAIANIVYAVTDELGKNRKERHNKTYPKIRGFRYAIIVKLIDRYCNIISSIENHNSEKFAMYKKENVDFIKGIGADELEYFIGDLDDGGCFVAKFDVIGSLVEKIEGLLNDD